MTIYLYGLPWGDVPEKFNKIVMTTHLNIYITGSTVKCPILGNFPGSKQFFLIMGGFMGKVCKSQI
jgi:hypothetical protein